MSNVDNIYIVYFIGVVIIPIVVALLIRFGICTEELSGYVEEEDLLIFATMLWPLILPLVACILPIKIVQFIAFGRRNHEPSIRD